MTRLISQSVFAPHCQQLLVEQSKKLPLPARDDIALVGGPAPWMGASVGTGPDHDKGEPQSWLGLTLLLLTCRGKATQSEKISPHSKAAGQCGQPTALPSILNKRGKK
jgi:hypothetical protein